jgi:antirestriction protein ArdC
MVEEMPNAPRIAHGGDRAFYVPSLDSVQVPRPESFESPAAYYSTIFHELTHHADDLIMPRAARALAPGALELISRSA